MLHNDDETVPQIIDAYLCDGETDGAIYRLAEIVDGLLGELQDLSDRVDALEETSDVDDLGIRVRRLEESGLV